MNTYEPQSKLLKGGYISDYIGTTIGVIKGDTRSLDNGSYVHIHLHLQASQKMVSWDTGPDEPS